jgi:hypothetical protein
VVELEEPSEHPLGHHDRAVVLRARGLDEHDVEDLHRVDHHVGRHHHDRRDDRGHDDPPEDLELGCAVDPGGLDDLVGDRLDRRGQDDHREAGLHPHHDHHQEEVVPRLELEPTDRVLSEPEHDPVEQPDVAPEAL